MTTRLCAVLHGPTRRSTRRGERGVRGPSPGISADGGVRGEGGLGGAKGLPPGQWGGLGGREPTQQGLGRSPSEQIS